MTNLSPAAQAVLGEWSASEFRHVDVENKICADIDTIRRALEELPNG